MYATTALSFEDPGFRGWVRWGGRMCGVWVVVVVPLVKGVLAVKVGGEGRGWKKPPGWGLEMGGVDDIGCVLDVGRD